MPTINISTRLASYNSKPPNASYPSTCISQLLLCECYLHLVTIFLVACPSHPLTKEPLKPYDQHQDEYMAINGCAWEAEPDCLRLVRYGLLRNYVQVFTYMYTQLHWRRLLLALVFGLLRHFRPEPRTPECRFCDSSNSQSTVDDDTDCPCGSKSLQIDWIAFVSVWRIRTVRSSVRKPSCRSRRKYAWIVCARHEVCSKASRVVRVDHGYSEFLGLNLFAVDAYQDDLLV